MRSARMSGCLSMQPLWSSLVVALWTSLAGATPPTIAPDAAREAEPSHQLSIMAGVSTGIIGPTVGFPVALEFAFRIRSPQWWLSLRGDFALRPGLEGPGVINAGLKGGGGFEVGVAFRTGLLSKPHLVIGLGLGPRFAGEDFESRTHPGSRVTGGLLVGPDLRLAVTLAIPLWGPRFALLVGVAGAVGFLALTWIGDGEGRTLLQARCEATAGIAWRF